MGLARNHADGGGRGASARPERGPSFDPVGQTSAGYWSIRILLFFVVPLAIVSAALLDPKMRADPLEMLAIVLFAALFLYFAWGVSSHLPRRVILGRDTLRIQWFLHERRYDYASLRCEAGESTWGLIHWRRHPGVRSVSLRHPRMFPPLFVLRPVERRLFPAAFYEELARRVPSCRIVGLSKQPIIIDSPR